MILNLILGGSEKTKGDADYSVADSDSEEITDIVGKNFMTGPVIDLQHSGHAASGSMTGRAGKIKLSANDNTWKDHLALRQTLESLYEKPECSHPGISRKKRSYKS